MEEKKPIKVGKNQRGRFKLVIFFMNHRFDRGFTLYSTRGQDVRGRSFERFKYLILKGKFAGQVKWAGIYEDGVRCWVFDARDAGK